MGEREALNCLAGLAWEQGDLSAARARYEEAVSLHSTTGEPHRVCAALSELGWIAFSRGEQREAARLLEQALDAARADDDAATQLVAGARLTIVAGGDVAALMRRADDLLPRLGVQQATEFRLVLWQATRDPAHLAEAKRLLDFLVEHAPPDCRESMLTNVRLHREIMAAWAAHGASSGS